MSRLLLRSSKMETIPAPSATAEPPGPPVMWTRGQVCASPHAQEARRPATRWFGRPSWSGPPGPRTVRREPRSRPKAEHGVRASLGVAPSAPTAYSTVRMSGSASCPHGPPLKPLATSDEESQMKVTAGWAYASFPRDDHVQPRVRHPGTLGAFCGFPAHSRQRLTTVAAATRTAGSMPKRRTASSCTSERGRSEGVRESAASSAVAQRRRESVEAHDGNRVSAVGAGRERRDDCRDARREGGSS